jgi:hypothetical protein
VAEREASGDFEYLWDDPADADGPADDESVYEPDATDDPEPVPADQWDEPGEFRHFDAFNASTWNFVPAPTPWYRSKPAATALVAAAAAMIAIVVSGVLLIFRGPGSTPPRPAPATQTASPTATAPASAPATLASPTESPPPPPTAAPPPPPPQTVASTVDRAPEDNSPRVAPRPTKQPEIGVTRTPVTRSPISVAPQPRSPR